MLHLDRIIFSLIFLTLTLSSPVPSHDEGQEPLTQRRPSLHELLRRNRNVASVFRSSSSASDLDLLPSAVENNKNRRVLVLGDGEDAPNYVYDDEIRTDTDVTDDKQKQFNDFDDNSDDNQSAIKDVGDKVTQKYATNFGSGELPSYADPGFLAAVMNQADKANFRYPVHSQGNVALRDQAASGSAKIETFSDSQTKEEINPYEMFPPSFHELLDIPLHVYANGTTYNPHKKFKGQKTGPVITRGYAAPKMNSANNNLLENEPKPIRIQNTRIRTTPQPQLNYFESQKIVTGSSPKQSISRYTPYTTTPEPTTPFHTFSSTKSVENKQVLYDIAGYIPSDNFENRLPHASESDSKRLPERPSLRFRTKPPATATKQIETYTTVTPRPTTTHVIEAVSKSSTLYPTRQESTTTQSTFSKLEVNDEVNIPGGSVYKNYLNNIYTSKEQSSYDYKNDREHENINNFIPALHDRRKPDVLNHESNFYNKDQNTVNFKDYFTITRDDNDIFFNSMNENLRKPERESHKDPLQVFDFPNFKSNFAQEGFMKPVKDKDSNRNSWKEKIVYEKNSLTEFNPSSRDPFAENSPVHTSFGDSKYKTEKVIIPTTFRPLHSLSRENPFVKPTTFRPHDAYSNIFIPKTDSFSTGVKETPDYIHEKAFEESGTSFTNSHSFVKPFRQYSNIFRDAYEKKEPKMEKGIPVYISSPIHDTVKIIQQEFDRLDQYPTLNIGLQPPPSFDFQASPIDEQYPLEYIPSTRRVHSPWNTNRQSGNSNRRPSFLQKLGLFRPRQVNRSGVSSSIVPLEELQKNRKGINSVDYVLSNGPAPANSRKVVVLGPFKEPPIGAPVLYPQNENEQSVATSVDINDDPFELKSSSLETLSQKTNPFVDQVKVISLPNSQANFRLSSNNMFDENESRDIVVQSKFEVGDQNHDYRQGSVMSVNRFDPSSIKVSEPSTSETIVQHISTAPKKTETKSLIRSAVQIRPRNYNFFEVSEEDKNRLIAAKFEIPRVDPVRRSGFQRNIIPIPVPMMTASGQQVLNFQDVNVPHPPVVKKVGRLLDTNMYNNIQTLILPSGKEIAASIHKPLVYDNNKKEVKSPEVETNSPKISRRKISSAEEVLTKLLAMEQPQSYREPSVSKISFGGWQAVGASPVQSYVKESSPFVIVKSYENQNSDKNSSTKLVEDNDKQRHNIDTNSETQ